MADLDLNFVASDVLDARITFSRASIGTYYDSAGVLQTASTNVPRFDYDPVTHAAKGLLIEAATPVGNSLTNSADFTAASYTKAGVTVTANQISAPDGTTTADLLTASASPSTLTVNFAVNDGQTYVISVFAKKGTTDWFYLCALTTGTTPDAPNAYFNLATGAVGTVDAAITAGMQDVGGGWYRCWIARPAPTGANERWNAGLCDANGSVTVTTGKTAYFWGGQFENQGTGGLGVPTSYVPTVASPVVRAADVAVMTGTNFSSWYNASAGTFVAEFDFIAASGIRGVVSADNAATNERIWLYGSGTDPKVAVTDGGTPQADIDVGTIAANTTYKLGISYALNDIAGCVNGGAVGTDTSATMPTPTQLRIGADATPNYLNGRVRRIQFWNTAVADATLQVLTDPLINDLAVTGSQTTSATTQSGTISGAAAITPGAGLVGSGTMGAYWAQDTDDRGYEASRKRRRKFLEDRDRRIRDL
jgi:hypothetical protein